MWPLFVRLFRFPLLVLSVCTAAAAAIQSVARSNSRSMRSTAMDASFVHIVRLVTMFVLYARCPTMLVRCVLASKRKHSVVSKLVAAFGLYRKCSPSRPRAPAFASVFWMAMRLQLLSRRGWPMQISLLFEFLHDHTHDNGVYFSLSWLTYSHHIQMRILFITAQHLERVRRVLRHCSKALSASSFSELFQRARRIKDS